MTGDAGEFGDCLRASRVSAQLSQEDLAGRSGVSVRAIGDMERGRTRWPHRDSVHRLADALGLADQEREGFLALARRPVTNPALAVAGPGRPAEAGSQRAVPQELPSTAPSFTGRSAQLRALTRLLDRSNTQDAEAIVISAIGGTVGVGKTALAVHWAHNVVDRFPDGQLYVNLRGYDPDQPMPVTDALAGFLLSLGVPGQDIPPQPEQRAARVFPLEDAVALLWKLTGARVDAERTAAAELAGQYCRLPLVLRIAAELAVSRPDVPLADLPTWLDLLDASGDPRTEVRAVFSWSYRHLDADTARAFRLLGLHPGPNFEPYAAAALTGTALPQARRALDVLARAHLIQPASPGRYGMHGLLRGYACELAVAEDDDGERWAALTRLFDHYLHAAAAAMDTLYPAERHHRPRIPRPATPVPPLPDPTVAREWLDGERAVLVAAAVHTAAHGWPSHAIRLAAILARYHHNGSHYPEACGCRLFIRLVRQRAGARAGCRWFQMSVRSRSSWHPGPGSGK